MSLTIDISGRKALVTGVSSGIGSNHAWGTIPGCFPYNVAKAGLLGLVQSLAIEWGGKIRTVGIAPGFIDTACNDAWFNSFPNPAAERARTEKLHPNSVSLLQIARAAANPRLMRRHEP